MIFVLGFATCELLQHLGASARGGARACKRANVCRRRFAAIVLFRRLSGAFYAFAHQLDTLDGERASCRALD